MPYTSCTTREKETVGNSYVPWGKVEIGVQKKRLRVEPELGSNKYREGGGIPPRPQKLIRLKDWKPSPNDNRTTIEAKNERGDCTAGVC